MQGENNLPSQSAGAEQQRIANGENLRQGYLKAMGIQTWFPRCQLANARPPRPFDWISEDAKAFAEVQNETRTADKLTTQPQHQSTADYAPTKPADILGQFMPTSTPVVEQSVVPEPRKQQLAPSSRFRLVVISVSDDCLVVAEMPHCGLNQFSRYHQKLLDDIIRALKLNGNNAPAMREFVWPMTDGRGLLSLLEQDDCAAADAVNVYLNTQHGLARRTTILLFGQAAARFVLDPQKNFDQLRGLQATSNQCFAVTHSLNELMKQPALKREAWQDLAPLLARAQPAITNPA